MKGDDENESYHYRSDVERAEQSVLLPNHGPGWRSHNFPWLVHDGIHARTTNNLSIIAGPMSSALSSRFSCRTMVLVGGVITSLGWFTTGFMPRLEYMFITYGLMAGTICCCVIVTMTTLVKQII